MFITARNKTGNDTSPYRLCRSSENGRATVCISIGHAQERSFEGRTKTRSRRNTYNYLFLSMKFKNEVKNKWLIDKLSKAKEGEDA